MSIAKTDIKLMASERLTDYYDGGGQTLLHSFAISEDKLTRVPS